MTTLATLSAVLIVAATPVAAGADAQRPDTTNWRCERCPFVSGYRGEAIVESSYVNDADARYGNFTGYDDNGAYVNASGRATYVGKSQHLTLDVANLGLDSRNAQLRGARPGHFSYSARYREIPWRRFDTTRTVFSASDHNGSLRLPAGWQPAATTAGFTNLATDLGPVDIKSDRRELMFGGAYRLSQNVELFSRFRHEERDGTLISAGANFTQAAELPRQIDFRTDELTAGIRYRGERGAFELGYAGSVFDNRNTVLRWENPFTAPPGAGQGAASESPDNTAHTLSFVGQVRAPHNTVTSVTGALSRLEQNEPFLQSTVNSTIVTGPLPRATLDGRVDHAHWAVNLSSRPFGLAHLQVSLSNTERNNRTPRASWERVVVDSFTSGEPELNPAYDFAKRRLKIRGDADLAKDFRISGGFAFTETKRNLQEVAEQEERDGWGQLRWRPTTHVEFKLKTGTAKREVDEYATQVATDLGQNPLLRKFNLAHRFREYTELQLTTALPNTPVHLTAGAALTNDDFSKSILGLTESEEQRLNLDLNWFVLKKAVVYLNTGYRSIESQQTGSQTFSTVQWRAGHEDTFASYGGGFRIDKLLEKFELRADLLLTRGQTTIDMAIDGSAVARLPHVDVDEKSLHLQATYAHSERLALVTELYYAQLETDDWALAGVTPAAIPTLLSLGAENYNYDVLRVSLGARYRFGD